MLERRGALRGNGAAAQRSEYQRRGRLVDVITAAATTTTS